MHQRDLFSFKDRCVTFGEPGRAKTSLVESGYCLAASKVKFHIPQRVDVLSVTNWALAVSSKDVVERFCH